MKRIVPSILVSLVGIIFSAIVMASIFF
ncbi:hypothetical protein ABTD07_19865 [Acinetobacter baumannii]